MPKRVRVVHYLNQFFAQIGGEDKGGVGPGMKEGPVGPGRALQQALGERGDVIATLFCGDNYFAEHPEESIEVLLRHLGEAEADLLMAGPAFEGGRYGAACGALCTSAAERLGIPVISGMDAENAGADLYRKRIYIVDSGSSATQMVPTLKRMVELGLRITAGESLGRPEQEGYLPRGVKRNELAAKPPAERAVDMLLADLRGEPVRSEITAPVFAASDPAKPVRNMASAVIALVTDGGLVTEGNPERMEPGRPTRFTGIPIPNLQTLGPDTFDVHHSGYDTRYANEDPHRLVPLDVMRALEHEGTIGKVHEVVYATGGAHAAVENATDIARAIAEKLKEARVDGVILTST